MAARSPGMAWSSTFLGRPLAAPSAASSCSSVTWKESVMRLLALAPRLEQPAGELLLNPPGLGGVRAGRPLGDRADLDLGYRWAASRAVGLKQRAREQVRLIDAAGQQRPGHQHKTVVAFADV